MGVCLFKKNKDYIVVLQLFVILAVLGVFGPGVPVNSRVSTKIQQLLNTLKRPKRPPLSEFFLDDSEEIVEGETQSVHIYYYNIYAYNILPLELLMKCLFLTDF